MIPNRPTDAAVAEAMNSLEGRIFDLRAAAHVLDELLEKRMGCTPQGDDLCTITLTGTEHDMISFAYLDLVGRASRLAEAFSAAQEGRELKP